MGKIKKIYKYTLLIVILFVVIPTSGFFVLKIPSVQSYLGERIMKNVSEKIIGSIEFSHIHFSYFNNVKINNLLIRDFSEDTLIYSPFVEVGIRRIKKSERLLRLGRINVESPVIKIKPDTTGNLNILYYIDFIIPEDTALRNRELSIEQILVNNGSLSFRSGEPEQINSNLLDPGNLNISELNVTIDNLDKLWKNLSLDLPELSFKTEKGFEITNMFTQIDIAADHIYLIDPTIRTPYSFINSDLIGVNLIGSDPEFDFIKDASLDLQLNTSLLSIIDLGFFIEKLIGFEQEITINGKLRGSVAELKGRGLNLSLSDTTRLIFDFDLSGLPDIDNTFMFIDIDEFSTHTTEIEAVNIPGKGFINLGDEVRRIGNISFSGNFTGFITDFVTYGRFNTDIGELSTDILFRPDSADSFVYTGSLEVSQANIGRLTGTESLLGLTSGSFEIDGSSESFDHFRANLNGNFDSIQFNGYNYRNILIDGLFTERIFDGEVKSNSENLSMDLLGRFDFSDSIPELDFSMNLQNANLYALNFDPGDSTSNLSMLLIANIIGNNIDNLVGEIRMLNSRLIRDGNELEIYDASLSASEIENGYSLNFKTDFIDAEVIGDYRLSSIGADIKRVAQRLAPALYQQKDSTIFKSNNNFSYSVTFNNSDKLNDFFNTGLNIAPGTFLTGRVIPDEIITADAYGDYIVYNNNSLLDFKLDAEIFDTVSSINIQSYKSNLGGRIDLDSLAISIGTLPDSARVDVKWNNPGSRVTGGELLLNGAVRKKDNGKRIFFARFMPSVININNKPWNIQRATIVVDSTSFLVDNLLLNYKNDFFNVNGTISEDIRDTLHFGFNNLNLSALNKIKARKEGTEEDKIDFFIDGNLNGEILLTNYYNNPLFETNLVVEDFKTNEHEHGDVTLLSEWDNLNRVANILFSNSIDGTRTFGIEGYYDPKNKNLNLLTEVNRFPLDVLNLVLNSFASGVNGYGSGSVYITGEPKAPEITGNVLAEDASMVIDYLQTRFMFSDTIILRDNSFIFNNITITDDKANMALLNGKVSHTAFNDFDVNIRIDADNLRVLDTRQKDNDLFFGTAYASGVINIVGANGELDLNITANTERNTKVFIPLNTSEKVSNYTFVSFSEPVVDSTARKEITLPIRIPEKSGTMGLNFDLDVTQDAEIQLVFDASVGDVLRSTGTGNLNISVRKDGTFAMYGSYTIEDGDYQLTLGNIFNKRFVVENGGNITWNGDINNSVLDIKAIYKLRASLYELLLDPSYRERIPVECHLNMSGQLNNPVIGFDIYLPTADEKTRTDLRNAINTDEEMSRQFLYLLVMNSFYPDPTFVNASGAASSGVSAMGVTTTEMLSNQLSNWLSQISNDFDIGFVYRPGNEISTQEVEVALSTQLLNDRVTINGNFAVAGQETSSSTNDLTGDFDVEVKLTEKVRLKVFNRSNHNLYYETAPYTQGFGFFFRQEFNRFRDIFKSSGREKDKDMKKEDEIKITGEK